MLSVVAHCVARDVHFGTAAFVAIATHFARSEVAAQRQCDLAPVEQTQSVAVGDSAICSFQYCHCAPRPAVADLEVREVEVLRQVFVVVLCAANGNARRVALENWQSLP